MEIAAAPSIPPLVALREVTVEDATAFRDFMCDEAYWRALPIDPPSLSSIRAHLARACDEATATPRVAWTLAAVEPGTDRLVGEGALRVATGPEPLAEIGWGVDPRRAGRGYGTAIGAALLRLAFDLGLPRVIGRCRPDNAASRAIMAKLGFHEEAIMPDDVLARGVWWDSVYAAIDARDG